MAYLFPRFAYTPVRCGPVRNDFGPLFSLFDDTARELQHIHRAARQSQKTFNPRFDVKEEAEAYVLEGEVPGFQESDLSIEWNDNTLAVSGKQETVTKSGNQPETVETPAVESAPASETGSVKSHQATVEDEEPTTTTEAVTEEASNEVTTTAAPQAPATTKPQQPEVQHWISERRSGQFLRQFAFPANAVNHEAIKASLQSGVLKIVVPKAEPQASRRINIE